MTSTPPTPTERRLGNWISLKNQEVEGKMNERQEGEREERMSGQAGAHTRADICSTEVAIMGVLKRGDVTIGMRCDSYLFR